MKGVEKIGAILLTAVLLSYLHAGAVSAQSPSINYDDFEDGVLGTSLGGAAGAMSYDGQHDPTVSIIADPGRGGKVLSIKYNIPANQWCGYWSFANDPDPDNPPHSTIDVSSYVSLSIWVKGAAGTEDLKIELKTDATRVSVYTITNVGTTWTRVNIPLSNFQKPAWIPHPVDLRQLRMVNLVISSDPWQSTIYVDDIMFLSASTTVSIQPATVTANVGYEFSVDVYVQPARNISGLQATLAYDRNLLTCTKVENGAFLGSNSYFGYDNRPGSLLLYGTVLGQNYASNPGIFARVYFKAQQQGHSDLRLQNLKVVVFDPSRGNVIEVPSIAENGTVTIINVPAWDVNMDGRVDILDLVVVGYNYGKTGTPGWIRADVDRDGDVDIRDLSLVALYFGG